MSLNSSFTAFVATNILPPIVAHLQAKGHQVSVDELLKVIDLIPSSPVVNTPVAQKSPKREPDLINGCQFKLIRVRKGQNCGQRRTANSAYCSRHRGKQAEPQGTTTAQVPVEPAVQPAVQPATQIPVQPAVQPKVPIQPAMKIPNLQSIIKPLQKPIPLQMTRVPPVTPQQPLEPTVTVDDDVDSDDEESWPEEPTFSETDKSTTTQ